MRLFIAIEFTDNIRNELKRFQQDLKRNGMSGRFVPNENLHLTLAFIGEYSDPEEILDIMEEVHWTSFQIKLDGVGRFNDLFWAGIAENPALAACTRRIRRALAEHGITFDRKKFSPHITLVRRAEADFRSIVEITEPPKGSMRVDRISLMRSDRGKSGMIYTEVGAIPADDVSNDMNF